MARSLFYTRTQVENHWDAPCGPHRLPFRPLSYFKSLFYPGQDTTFDKLPNFACHFQWYIVKALIIRV